MPSRRRFVAGAGCLVAGAAGIHTVASAGLEPSPTDWPMPRHDAAGTGYNPAGSGPTDDVSVRWERSTDGSVFRSAPPILVDGTLFTTGQHSFAAFDAATGEKRFERSGSFSSSPAWIGSDVYRTDTLAVSGRAGVFGLNAGGGYELAGWSIGAERWHAPGRDQSNWFFSPPTVSAPVVADGTIFAVVPGTKRVVALHPDSGRTEWSYSMAGIGGSPLHRPAVRDGVVYLAKWPHAIHAVDADTGESLWKAELDIRVIRPPTATNEGVVLPGRGAVVLADPADGTPIWTYEHDGNATEGSAAVADGTVFVTDGDRGFHAIDLATGEQRWRVEYGGQVAPVVADGVVYAASPWANDVTALDAATGDRLWTWDGDASIHSQPTVGDGVLYVTTFGGLVALEEA